MLRITLIIVGLLVAAIAVILVIAATKPDTFAVTRRTTINASPEKVQALLDDFHAWQAWSPWEVLDPAMKREYSGPAKGVGSAYRWDSEKAGAGRMKITGVDPGRKVDIDLDFTKPFPANNKVDFVLTPTATGTEVRWTMSGPAPFLSKVMQVFFSMDRMIGKDFETGLANLKTAAEG